MNLNEYQKAIKIDLERKLLFQSIEQKNNIIYFPTEEGNIICIEKEKEIRLNELRELSQLIPHCILGIISQDSSIVYYSIESITLQFKK